MKIALNLLLNHPLIFCVRAYAAYLDDQTIERGVITISYFIDVPIIVLKLVIILYFT